jgi:hypothetical protein
MQVARRTALERVAQYRFQGRKAGAAGNHQRGARLLAVSELPHRPLDLEQRARLETLEHSFAEVAPGDVPHVQLDEARIVRRGCDREAAPPTSLEQHIQVLPGPEIELLDGRQAQPHLHHIGREPPQRFDAAWQGLDLHVGDRRDQPCLDGEVAAGARLAQQDVALRVLLGRQPERGSARILDLPGDEPRAA